MANQTLLTDNLVELASVGNFIWHDLDADGIQDKNEFGIERAKVFIRNEGENVTVMTTSTDANGKYKFEGLLPGKYTLGFARPDGFSLSSFGGAGTDDSLDSDGTLVRVDLAAGENNLSIDSAFYNLASLGDYVFADNNGDGIQNSGDTALEGVTVQLIDGNGNVMASTTTAADGSYLFNNLYPGDYQVQFTAPDGFEFTTANQGSDAQLDSDVDSKGLSKTVTLTSGENNLSLDAGLVELASVGNFIWHDLDADGIQDENEAGIEGATVYIRNEGENVTVMTTSTDANGEYKFEGLPPGEYTLGFRRPDGFSLSSLPDSGEDDDLDSDGTLVNVILTPGEKNFSIDSGFYNLTSLGDYVFADNNGDGIQNTGDAALEGVTVKLLDGNSKVMASTTTAADGSYLFDRLYPGDYQVQFTAPDGFEFTTANQGSDEQLDSDVDSNGLSEILTLTSGENNLSLDAGLVQLASLGDYVFADNNGDGIQNSGDTALEGVTVQLLDGNSKVMASTTTAADGSYLFDRLYPGDYQVQFTAPDGFEFTTANQGSDEQLDSDVDSNGLSEILTLTSGENNLSLDAGLVEKYPAPQGDLSEIFGQPQALTFTYIPGDSVQTGGKDKDNDGFGDQDGKAQIESGFKDDDSSAYIVVTNKNNLDEIKDGRAVTYFTGNVKAGESFTASVDFLNGDTFFENDTRILVFEDEAAFLGNNDPLQVMKYKTDGSQPMEIGDTIGSVKVAEYFGETGYYDDPNIQPLEGEISTAFGDNIIFGQPQALTFTYIPGDLVKTAGTDSDNDGFGDQDGKAEIESGFSDDDNYAYIVVASKDNLGEIQNGKAKTYFAGNVKAGESFTASVDFLNGDTFFENDTHILVFEDETAFLTGDNPLQEMKYKTDGNQIMKIGDVIGSVQVAEYFGEKGYYDDPNIDPITGEVNRAFELNKILGKPVALSFEYNNADTLFTNQSSSDAQILVNNGIDDDGTSHIIVTDEEKASDALAGVGNEYFVGDVSFGSVFEANSTNAGLTTYGDKTYVHYFDDVSGDLLRSVQYKTKGDRDMLMGDDLSGLELVGYLGENGSTGVVL